MKDFIISLLSVIIGTSFLSVAVVNDKFKNNIRVIISLIIAVSALRGLPGLDFNSVSDMLSLNRNAESVSDSKEASVKDILNDAIEENLRQNFGVETVYADIEIILNESYVEILSLSVEVDTDIKLLSIRDYLEYHLRIPGNISVTRIKNEGIK